MKFLLLFLSLSAAVTLAFPVPRLDSLGNLITRATADVSKRDLTPSSLTGQRDIGSVVGPSSDEKDDEHRRDDGHDGSDDEALQESWFGPFFGWLPI
ncbi:hypothetical protein Q5752_001291 [Cryptotrichosporon argae]